MSKPFFATLGILAIGIASYATTYMRLETNDGRISKVDVDNVSQIDFVEETLAPGELSPEIEAKLETKTYTFRGVSFKMIYVKGGSLNMGAQPSDNTLDGYDSKATWAESPVHKVTLSSYAIGETEVTQALWNTLNISPNERLDLRSYERQGKEELPTVHLGASVSHMEAKGIRTELGNYNRQIIEHNTALKKLKKKLGWFFKVIVTVF